MGPIRQHQLYHSLQFHASKLWQSAITLSRILPHPTVTDSVEELPAQHAEVLQSGEEEEDGDKDFEFEQLKFEEQGQLVTVYCLEHCFVGEVTAVVSPQEGVVNFMEKATFPVQAQAAFRWPSRKDDHAITADFIFAKGIVLHLIFLRVHIHCDQARNVDTEVCCFQSSVSSCLKFPVCGLHYCQTVQEPATFFLCII